MSSVAAKVNEKHYQARLLLAMSDNCELPAQHAALEAAACLLLSSSYRLFIQEVADSCQLSASFSGAHKLHAALLTQQRSHAVVETLLELEADNESWLARLLAGEIRLDQGEPLNKKHAANALVLQEISQTCDVADTLSLFTDFVGAQRSFLSEW